MKLLITSFLLLLVISINANGVKCCKHEYYLTQQNVGTEHINHHLFLNGKLLIKELADGMWFIETITCNETGFKITASHKQYGDPEIREFLLVVKNTNEYEIK